MFPYKIQVFEKIEDSDCTAWTDFANQNLQGIWADGWFF